MDMVNVNDCPSIEAPALSFPNTLDTMVYSDDVVPDPQTVQCWAQEKAVRPELTFEWVVTPPKGLGAGTTATERTTTHRGLACTTNLKYTIS